MSARRGAGQRCRQNMPVASAQEFFSLASRRLARRAWIASARCGSTPTRHRLLGSAETFRRALGDHARSAGACCLSTVGWAESAKPNNLGGGNVGIRRLSPTVLRHLQPSSRITSCFCAAQRQRLLVARPGSLAGTRQTAAFYERRARCATTTTERVRRSSIGTCKRVCCQYSGVTTVRPGTSSTRVPARNCPWIICTGFSAQPMPAMLASMKPCVEGNQCLGVSTARRHTRRTHSACS